MKSIIEIEAAATALSKITKRLRKKAEAITRAKNDAAVIQSEIEALGTPHYSDDAALLKLTLLERKGAGCARAIEQLENEFSECVPELVPAVQRAGMTAAQQLEPVFEIHIDNITRALAPFSHDAQGARALAIQTDAVRMAYARLQGLTSLSYNRVILNAENNPEAAIAAVASVSEILSEGRKAHPNLIQFLSFSPSALAAPVEPAGPKAAVQLEAAGEKTPDSESDIAAQHQRELQGKTLV